MWFSLHGAAACRALGVYDVETITEHITHCDAQLQKICAKCHEHFQEQKARIITCEPIDIERAIYDIHAQASAERDEFYVAPDFEAVRARYRAYVAEIALVSLTGERQKHAR